MEKAQMCENIKEKKPSSCRLHAPKKFGMTSNRAPEKMVPNNTSIEKKSKHRKTLA